MENIDKESRFAHLLKPIRYCDSHLESLQFYRELADNWDIDIANDLENYLEELESVSINLGDGYRNLNFAEAALLIQVCVLVEHWLPVVCFVLWTIGIRVGLQQESRVSVHPGVRNSGDVVSRQ